MSIRRILNRNFEVPILGRFAIKDFARWAFIGLGVGVAFFAIPKIPVVGPSLAGGINKIRGYFAWNQA